MAKYNKSLIFKYTWRIFKGQSERTEQMFSTCLKEAWKLAKTNPMALEEEKVMTFDAMYKKHYADVLTYVNGKVRNRELAEEITNDTFMKSTNYKFDSKKATMKTWLCYISNGIIIDHFRNKYTDENYAVRVSDFVDENGTEIMGRCLVADEKTDSLTVDNEFKTRIEKVFSTLKPKYKRIATLYFLEEQGYNEIAELCNVPMGTVKGMISRCREALQNELQNEKKEYGIR